MSRNASVHETPKSEKAAPLNFLAALESIIYGRRLPANGVFADFIRGKECNLAITEDPAFRLYGGRVGVDCTDKSVCREYCFGQGFFNAQKWFRGGVGPMT